MGKWAALEGLGRLGLQWCYPGFWLAQLGSIDQDGNGANLTLGVLLLGCLLELSGELKKNTDAWVPSSEILISLVWGPAGHWSFSKLPGDSKVQPN